MAALGTPGPTPKQRASMPSDAPPDYFLLAS